MIDSPALFGWIALAINLAGACLSGYLIQRYIKKLREIQKIEDHAEALYVELVDMWLSQKERGGPPISPPPIRLKPIRH